MALNIRLVAATVLLAVGGGPALADDVPDSKPPYPVNRVLDDGRSVITYTGGYYVGFTLAQTDGGAPIWHGRCEFYFKAGATFKGTCANGKFERGYISSKESVIYFDVTRDEVKELPRPAKKRDL